MRKKVLVWMAGMLCAATSHLFAQDSMPQWTKALCDLNHLVAFNSDTDYLLCYTIRALLDGVLKTPQGLEDVPGANVQSTKVLRDGQFYILRGNKTYSIQGQLIQQP